MATFDDLDAVKIDAAAGNDRRTRTPDHDYRVDRVIRSKVVGS